MAASCKWPIAREVRFYHDRLSDVIELLSGNERLVERNSHVIFVQGYPPIETLEKSLLAYSKESFFYNSGDAGHEYMVRHVLRQNRPCGCLNVYAYFNAVD
jgi:hypothetical protein